jgi:hypothetical protein
MNLSYVIADIGYNLQELNLGTALLVMAGWVSLLCRIYPEERILDQNAGWAACVSVVRCRIIPGLW